MAEQSIVTTINEELNKQLTKETAGALLATTFKGLDAIQMKQAIMEGMIRGFNFKDFLEKNLYAIPFAGGYSLITSIDYARKIGMRSGVVGKKKPIYTYDDKGKIISCEVTIQKRVNGFVGDFTAEVFFSEYYKAGRNGKPSLWDQKPHTMIAKVAEMHALRMACPEEMSQLYVEEEMTETPAPRIADIANVDTNSLKMGNFLKKDEKDNTENQEVQNTNSDEVATVEVN